MMNLKVVRGEILSFQMEGPDEAEVEKQVRQWCKTFL